MIDLYPVEASERSDRTLRVQLDACLNVLEDANERDEGVVSRALASCVGPVVPGVVSGMSIAQAIDMVFDAQEQSMKPPPIPQSPRGSSRRTRREPRSTVVALHRGATPTTSDSMTPAEARELTERIKRVADSVSLLLLEAQERQAWAALGHHTWERYVSKEFGLSRTRSYELLDHGRLVRTIEAVTGVCLAGTLPPYAARRLKPCMDRFVLELEARSAGRREDEMPALVRDVIDAVAPRKVAPGRRRLGAGLTDQFNDAVAEAIATRTIGSEMFRADPEVVILVFEYLARMPPASSLVGQLRSGGLALPEVERVRRWLTDLAGQLRVSADAGRPAVVSESPDRLPA